MAFELTNFKEAGQNGNSLNGGQMYSVFSDTDNLATMMASGYLDAIVTTLNVKDNVLLGGTDGSSLVQVNAISSGVISVETGVFVNSPIESLTYGVAAQQIISSDPVLEVNMTHNGTAELQDGVEGQRLIISIVSGGGEMTLEFVQTTTTNLTQILFTEIGDSVLMSFLNGAWSLISKGGNAGGPVVV